ncbi:MAG: sensor histidine kinase [Propionibacteriaceae bacterium]|jgi:signal transduction histidine kinase|nr:sensor histidine kinase [Propionibacteriaceae bacterium]
MVKSGVAPRVRIRTGWDVVLAGTLGLLSAYIITVDSSWLWWPPVISIALWYAALGRRLVARPDARLALVFSVGLIILIGWATWRNPWLAPIQIIAFPLLWWVTLPNERRAVVLSVLMGLAAGVGQFWSPTDDRALGLDLWLSFVIPLLILVVTIVGGLWLGRVTRWGQDRLGLVDALESAQARTVALEKAAAARDERARLARDIHDTIAQDLAGLAMLSERANRQTAALVRRLPPEAETSAQPLISTLTTLTGATRMALEEARSLIAGAMPIQLESSLADALRRLAARFERETTLEVTVKAADHRLDREAEVVLLRCAQEGLSNVRKHSGATRADISVVFGADTAVLTVADNGRGLPETPTVGGFGWSGMRERLSLVGGEIQVESAPGAGCRLVVTMPARRRGGGSGAAANDGGRP